MAKRFKRWITSEVLSSLRKNGGYIAGQEQMTPEQIVANALIVAQNIITSKDKQIQEMKPKVVFEFLRNAKILDIYNKPYQRYVDCGWFRQQL